MWLENFSFYPINIPFINAIKVGQETIEKKQSIYLKLTFSNKKSGIGEVSLLPGLIKLSIQEAEEEIKSFLTPLIKKKLNHLKEPINESQLSTLFFNKLPKPQQKLSSPIVFALESAILTWNKVTFPKNFEGLFPEVKESFSIPVNDLLYPKDCKFDLKASAFKIKIGRFDKNNKEKEISFIKTVAKKLRQKNQFPKRIRLDGNKSFTPIALQNYINRFDTDTIKQIEYLEEPLKDINQWNEFYKTNKIGLGLDESILNLKKKAFSLPMGVEALILKPSQIGGISKFFFFSNWGLKRKIKIVVSSTFESSLGLFTLSILASKQKNTPSGLNTYKFLEEKDPLYSFETLNGKMIIKKNLTR